MDPRQMVALRKALGGEGAESPEEMAPAMEGPEPVTCPGCGETFVPEPMGDVSTAAPEEIA
jgi:hypothetical protein